MNRYMVEIVYIEAGRGRCSSKISRSAESKSAAIDYALKFFGFNEGNSDLSLISVEAVEED